jgi:hypothetical protein
VLAEDFINAVVGLETAGTATTTIKFFASMGKSDGSCPNFGATVSAANPYTFIQAINLDTAATVNGATGEVVAGTDIAKTYEVNLNAVKYLAVLPVSWSAGSISARLMGTINS